MSRERRDLDDQRGSGKRRKAVFLDRDGTLIEDKDYLKDPGQVVLESGAAEAVARLNEHDFAVILVSNQSAVARGYCTEEDVAAVHQRLGELLAAGHARLDAMYYCPHSPEGVVEEYRQTCACRKPATGMYQRASKEWDIDITRSYMIGDKLTDMEAARNAGLTGVLVRTGYGQDEWKASLQVPDTQKADRVVIDLREAVDFVLWAERHLTVAEPAPREEDGPACLWTSKWVSRSFLKKCLDSHRRQDQTLVLARTKRDAPFGALDHAGVEHAC